MDKREVATKYKDCDRRREAFSNEVPSEFMLERAPLDFFELEP